MLKAQRTGENLDDASKAMRQAFVAEYVKDFNATKAVIRMGWNGAIGYIRKKGSELLREPYVQQLIEAFLASVKEDAIVTRQRILAGLVTEANNAPEAATRVNAWAHLGKMLGMYVEKKEVNITGSGVMLVPATGTPDDWERAAEESQRKLKQDAAEAHG